MIISALLITLKISIISVFISAIITILLAWKINKVDKKRKKIIEWIVTLPIFFSPSAIGYVLLLILGKKGIIGGYLYSYFDIKIIFTWWAGVIATSVVIFPILYQNIKSGLLGIESSYIEAAKEMGASKWQTLIHIQLPMIKKNIFTGLLLAFGRAVGEFGATLMIAGNIPGRTQTIPMAIYSAVELGDYKSANIILLIISVISFIILIFYNYNLKKD